MAGWTSEDCDNVMEQYKKYKPRRTNSDRIRAMTDEELAEIILHNSDKCLGDMVRFCQNKDECSDILDDGFDIPESMCKQYIMDWLQKEVEE